jgi:hypothetical protein
MSWFYARNSERMGPVDQAEFERLVQAGVIAAETLVWREGMADWQSYGQVSAASVLASSPPLMSDSVVCVECGRAFPADQTVKLPPGAVCAGCKPLVMQKLGEGLMASSVEQIRTTHLQHEASVKSVGLLYYLGGGAMLLFTVISLAGGRAEGFVLALIFALLGAGQIAVGTGLRKLRPWARIPTGILSGIGLLGFPLGTLINGYILYLIFCQKGATVFSPDYQRVMAATPHLRYRTSIVVWIFLALVAVLVGVAIFGFVLAPRR